MQSPSRRSSPRTISAWLAAHQRLITVGLFAFVAVLAVIATALALGVAGSRPETASAPSGSPESSSLSSDSPAPSAQPSPDDGSPTPQPPDPESPSPTDAAVGTDQLAQGWVEVGSFGANGAIESVSDVVQAPFGYLAAGVRIGTRDVNVFGPLPQEGRIWLSADGQSWEDVTPPGGTFADSSVYQLMSLPDGAVLAFARVSVLVDADPEYVFAAWETRDGRTWTGSEISAGTAPVLRGVAGGAGYLTAIGSDFQTQLWHAADGRSYAPVTDPTDGRIITAMGAGPQGFVILGSVYESAEPPKAYASANGLDWYEATTGNWEVGGIAALGPDWVAIGRGSIDGEWRDMEVPTWLSSNGIDWAEAGEIPSRAVELSAGVTCQEFLSEPVSSGRLVVVSTTLSYPCGEGNVQRFGASSVTANGATWETLPFTVEASAGAEGTRGATVTSGLDIGSGTLLVGEKGYRATFWFRPGE